MTNDQSNHQIETDPSCLSPLLRFLEIHLTVESTYFLFKSYSVSTTLIQHQNYLLTYPFQISACHKTIHPAPHPKIAMASTTTTLIFGGSGKVARHITSLLSKTSNHTVHSIIRKAEQSASISELGGEPIVQSIEDSSVEDMAATIKSTKASNIIWSAGAGGGSAQRTQAVDRDGAIRCMDAAALAGVKRFVLVSAVDVRDRQSKPEPEWYDDGDRERSDSMWKALGPYMEAKLAADRSLVTENGRRGLDYTIVRPGRLSEEAATGKVEAGKVHLANSIPREDVARVVIECLKQDGTIGLAFDVVGGQTAIQQAVASVTKDKTDTFEGRY
jgi:nucleoside-diphosphate-sugar epimerase